MTRFQKAVHHGWFGFTGLCVLVGIALFIIGAAGCGTNESHSLLGPEQIVTTPAGAYVAMVEIEGKLQKCLVVNDRNAPKGVKVIMVLDYPCGAVGPLPAGHGRDCTGTTTPSDEPPPSNAASIIGDPTNDD